MPERESNPLFTRGEHKRAKFLRATRRRKSSLRHQAKGFARAKLGSLFGIPLNRDLLTGKGRTPDISERPRRSRRGSRSKAAAASSSSIHNDVFEALVGQGYKRSQAKSMVAKEQPGDTFASLFRRSIAKNPGELIIFGNPERVISRRAVLAARKKNIIIPTSILQGLGFEAGSKMLDAATSKRKKKRGRRNPDAATDLFEQFHHRSPEGIFERQISAKHRKEYTILGPLVALGIDGEKFDKINPNPDDVVEHWEKLPHLAFLTSHQVDQVKSMLGDPNKYVKDAPLLASAPNGKQLYVISDKLHGLPLDRFEGADKDFVDLGECTFVVYIAKKPVEPVEWVHTFGEEGGERPRLAFDRINKQIFFLGGSYRVEAPGIVN